CFASVIFCYVFFGIFLSPSLKILAIVIFVPVIVLTSVLSLFCLSRFSIRRSFFLPSQLPQSVTLSTIRKVAIGALFTFGKVVKWLVGFATAAKLSPAGV